MKILIIGTNTIADLLTQRLLSEHNVECVYHYGAHVSRVPTDRFKPQSMSAGVSPLLQFLASAEGSNIDLIVPTTLYFQLRPGLFNAARANNIPILTPTAGQANIEWSKITGKRLLNHLNIPTAAHSVMTHKAFFDSYYDIKRPFVVKYEKDWRSGLQTVVVTDNNYQEEYNNLVNAAPRTFLADRIVPTDLTFIVEDYIDGAREYSWHAICNDTGMTFLGAARDYKKRYENDIGHNTASMGSYSPVPDIDQKIEVYANRIVQYFKDRGTPFKGILYLGIMISASGEPYVLEINTRFGSPETESILQTIDNNIADLLYSIAANKQLPAITVNDKVGVSLRVVNKQYVEKQDASTLTFPQLWPLVDGIQYSMCADSTLLHSVITVADTSIDAASDKLYKFLKDKPMGDFTYRTDIGYCK